jgi:hypothetical protein
VQETLCRVPVERENQKAFDQISKTKCWKCKRSLELVKVQIETGVYYSFLKKVKQNNVTLETQESPIN